MRRITAHWRVIGIMGLLLSPAFSEVALSQSSGLSAEARRDAYLSGLAEALKKKDFEESLNFISRLRDLPTEMPPTIDYFEAEANCQTERYIRCEEAAIRYVNETGSSGRYYNQALKLIVLSEPFSTKARESISAEQLEIRVSEVCGAAPIYEGKNYVNVAAVNTLSEEIREKARKAIVANENICYQATATEENRNLSREACKKKRFRAKKDCEARSIEIGVRAYRLRRNCQPSEWIRKDEERNQQAVALLLSKVKDFENCTRVERGQVSVSQSEKIIQDLLKQMVPSLVPDGKCALIVASRKTNSEIRTYIDNFSTAKTWYWGAYESSNGWFAISAGFMEEATSEEVINKLISEKSIPDDAYCASGKKFIRYISY